MDDQFLAVGKATTEAKAFYQEHALIWAVYWDNLRTIEANSIIVKGGSRDIWVKPTRIKFGPDGSASVTVTRCVDNSHLVVVQDGKTVPQDGDVRGVSSVELSRFKDAPWKITVADKEVGKC